MMEEYLSYSPSALSIRFGDGTPSAHIVMQRRNNEGVFDVAEILYTGGGWKLVFPK
jgi:hypothetical protein